MCLEPKIYVWIKIFRSTSSNWELRVEGGATAASDVNMLTAFLGL